MGISKLFGARLAAGLLVASSGIAFAGAAQAANVLYMVSSNPWGQQSEHGSLDLAFGAGNWDKLYGLTTAAFNGDYDFVYIDGGDGASSAFNSFVTGNIAAIESFVNGGGRLMLNAGRWDQPSIATGNGTTLVAGYSQNASLTAAGLAAGLNADGAGNSWTGGYFAHDVVGGVDTCYVTGSAGCIFGSKGNLFVGGATAPYFQSGGATELLANELKLAAGPGGAVPEPASWAMMLGGFGMIGGALRSRRKAAVSFA